MFSDFQARYPTGSLVSELLHIHEGHFVVKAVVQVGGVTLASGMSAAETIEQAEDQARIRAMAVLGFEPPTYESQAHLMGQQTPAQLNPSQAFPREANETSLAGHSDWIPGLVGTKGTEAFPPKGPEKTSASDPESARETHPSPPPVELPLETPSANFSPPPNLEALTQPNPPSQISKNGSGSRSKNSAPSPQTLAAPTDLSDVIAQTSVELKRLGWTNAEGRNYLQTTYSKRSRQQLSDQELMDFLQHLQSQPSLEEPSF